jgi:hypothetical protein
MGMIRLTVVMRSPFAPGYHKIKMGKSGGNLTKNQRKKIINKNDSNLIAIRQLASHGRMEAIELRPI